MPISVHNAVLVFKLYYSVYRQNHSILDLIVYCLSNVFINSLKKWFISFETLTIPGIELDSPKEPKGLILTPEARLHLVLLKIMVTEISVLVIHLEVLISQCLTTGESCKISPAPCGAELYILTRSLCVVTSGPLRMVTV